MVGICQELKMPKTCEKRFYQNIRVVLCKKPLEKKAKYSTYKPILKMGYLAGAIALEIGQSGSKIKICEKRFYKNIRAVLCQKPLEKAPNIRQMRPF